MKHLRLVQKNAQPLANDEPLELVEFFDKEDKQMDIDIYDDGSVLFSVYDDDMLAMAEFTKEEAYRIHTLLNKYFG